MEPHAIIPSCSFPLNIHFCVFVTANGPPLISDYLLLMNSVPLFLQASEVLLLSQDRAELWGGGSLLMSAASS